MFDQAVAMLVDLDKKLSRIPYSYSHVCVKKVSRPLTALIGT